MSCKLVCADGLNKVGKVVGFGTGGQLFSGVSFELGDIFWCRSRIQELGKVVKAVVDMFLVVGKGQVSEIKFAVGLACCENKIYVLVHPCLLKCISQVIKFDKDPTVSKFFGDTL